MMRRRFLQAGLAAGAGFAGLPARACEFFTPTLRVIHPWTRETAEGDTSAVVCMSFDDVSRDDRLIGIRCAVAAGAEMGGAGVPAGARPAVDFAIPQGRASQLSEGGTYLRLMGLTQPLELGRSYPIELLFEAGGVLHADLSVDYEQAR